MVIGLDIDAPFPSFGVLGPILHWIQPDLQPDADAGTDQLKTLKTTSGSGFVANYIGPAPPPGSAPHRYVFLLYEQPRGFDVGKYAPADGQELGLWGRVRWDLAQWEREVGLGEVRAANYFRSN